VRSIPMIGLFSGGKMTAQIVGARPRHLIEAELGLEAVAKATSSI